MKELESAFVFWVTAQQIVSVSAQDVTMLGKVHIRSLSMLPKVAVETALIMVLLETNKSFPHFRSGNAALTDVIFVEKETTGED